MASVEDTYVFSPALVNTVRVGLSRIRGDINSPVSGDKVATDTALAVAPGAIGPPQIGVPGVLMFLADGSDATGLSVKVEPPPFVRIGDVNHPWLRAYVGQNDLGRVKLGTKVNLSTDSYPGKTYSGQISFISSEAEFTPKQIQTKEERVKLVYRIKVEVDNSSHDLKNNMPVDAEIVL